MVTITKSLIKFKLVSSKINYKKKKKNSTAYNYFQKLEILTHTHTHTHIYIYIYIYAGVVQATLQQEKNQIKVTGDDIDVILLMTLL